MKAVGYRQSLPIDHEDALLDLELPKPVPGPRDLLVEVRAISVNPVDTKIRKRATPPPGEARILGWDAVGIIVGTGPDVTLFREGDKVFYSGALGRPGTNAEYHVIDERLVGPAPKKLSAAEAAALPLTAITAWELLFDRLGATYAQTGTLLIVGGAGGVGSILIQLARKLTGLQVVATASRPETRAWCLQMGAHHVIDHTKPLRAGLEEFGCKAVEMVAGLTATDVHLEAIADVIAPQGRFAVIDDPPSLDINRFKTKSVSVHWELMFTRSMFETPDMAEQGKILSMVSALIDDSTLRTTTGANLGKISAANLKKAHALIESGKTIGKLVLEGF